MTWSRREFGKATLAALPLSLMAAKTNGVTLGVMTYSYRALPQTPGVDRVDGQIEALKANGTRDIELFEEEVQPPSKVEGLDKWRAASQMDHFTAARKKLDAAGITTHA